MAFCFLKFPSGEGTRTRAMTWCGRCEQSWDEKCTEVCNVEQLTYACLRGMPLPHEFS